jgi:hypothetical protein
MEFNINHRWFNSLSVAKIGKFAGLIQEFTKHIVKNRIVLQRKDGWILF